MLGEQGRRSSGPCGTRCPALALPHRLRPWRRAARTESMVYNQRKLCWPNPCLLCIHLASAATAWVTVAPNQNTDKLSRRLQGTLAAWDATRRPPAAPMDRRYRPPTSIIARIERGPRSSAPRAPAPLLDGAPRHQPLHHGVTRGDQTAVVTPPQRRGELSQVSHRRVLVAPLEPVYVLDPPVPGPVPAQHR